MAGRGFYIVLLACVAVIGVSAWTLILPRGSQSGSYVDYSLPGAITPQPEWEPEWHTDLEPYDPTPELPDKGALLEAEGEPPPDEAAELEATAMPATAEDEPEPEPLPAVKPETEPPTSEHGGNSAKKISDLIFARPIAGEITMEYSVDALVYSRTLGDWRTHAGIDIAGALGAKVQAVCDGSVSEITRDDMLGTMVIIDHGFGLRSIYANLASEPAVKVGDKVSLGAVVGAVGTTALAESGEVTHLHFAMELDGESVDPQKYIP